MEVLQLLTDIDLVIFDLGGVLYEIDFERTRSALRALPGYNGAEVIFGVDAQDAIFQRIDRGDCTDAEFYDDLRRTFGFTCPDDAIEAAWCAILIGPYSYASDLIRSVGTMPAKALLSNISWPHLHHALPSMADMVRHFDATFYSCAIGLRKPDPAAFLHVTSTMNAAPERTLLIDDSAANCASARALGIRTWHFTPEA